MYNTFIDSFAKYTKYTYILVKFIHLIVYVFFLKKKVVNSSTDNVNL